MIPIHVEKDLPRTIVCWGEGPNSLKNTRETVDQLLARKLDVVTFDWRGQGLSDRILPNRYKGYVASYEDYLKDLTNFMDRHVSKSDRPVVMLAHSMGGHIALRYLHDNPDRVEKAVLTSPLSILPDRPP